MRNALFVLFIGGILAYGAGLAWHMLARFDLVDLIRGVNADDAFYYFEIASNLAEGKFSTFDGGITRTNGYHPLWLFLITPFYWVFDKEAALFAIKAFEVMLVAGGVALVAAAARLARMPWYLMFAALPMLYQQPGLIQGMEAAAALFMLCLFILAACLFARSPARWRWPLAAVAFALPWVRLEYIAISVAATAALWFVEWSRRERAPGAPIGKRARSALSVKAAVPLLAAGASILVYFAYNRLVFGGVVPVSGATKAAWSQRQWESEGGYSLTQNLLDASHIGVFDLELRVALEVCAYLLLVWWFARRSRNREDWLLLAFLAGVSGLAVGHLAKFGQTVLTVHPFYQGDFPWYFVPAYLMMALIIPARCYVAIHFIRRFIGPESRRVANVLSLGVVVAGAVFLFAKADFTAPFRGVEASSSSTRPDTYGAAVYGGTQLTNRALPEDSVVGSWDAGIVGYFSRFPVVNLDGLVSSYDYFHATDADGDGYAIWHEKFIPLYRELGITHFANLTKVGFEGKALLEGSLVSASGQEFYLWPIEPPEDDNTATRIWNRVAPHFEHRADDFGLLVDGRLVQTIGRECDPNELVAWHWPGPSDGTVANSWTRMQTGLCVAAHILPRHALPPVGVEMMPADDYLTRLVGDRAPVIRSDWDVYLVEDRLVYAKARCSPEDAEPMFSLHLDPVEVNDLPGHRRQHGFDNLDFAAADHDFIKGGVCMATRKLPDYAIAEIRTGQYAGEHRIWRGSFYVVEPADDGRATPVRFEAMPAGDWASGPLVGDRPVIRSSWDVYLVEDRLVYAKHQCSPEDAEPTFFLHLDPVEVNDLPVHRRQHGFDNLDFAVAHDGFIEGGVCVATRKLPDYGIAEIRTGQYAGENHIWEDRFNVVGPADDGNATQ